MRAWTAVASKGAAHIPAYPHNSTFPRSDPIAFLRD